MRLPAALARSVTGPDPGRGSYTAIRPLAACHGASVPDLSRNAGCAYKVPNSHRQGEFRMMQLRLGTHLLLLAFACLFAGPVAAQQGRALTP